MDKTMRKWFCRQTWQQNRKLANIQDYTSKMYTNMMNSFDKL